MLNNVQPSANAQGWFPSDYNPGFTVQDWLELLGDPEVFTADSLTIMKRLKDFGGQATCKQLSLKYGGTVNFYNNGSWHLARRIYGKTQCRLLDHDTHNSQWWPILYLGRYVGKDTPGVYMWKLREELSQALDQVNLSGYDLYEQPQNATCQAKGGAIDG